MVMVVFGCKVIFEYFGVVVYGKFYLEFWVQVLIDGCFVSVGNGSYVGFFVDSKVQVDVFYVVVLVVGVGDEGVLGLCLFYGEFYYGCFICDFDGYKVEVFYWDMSQGFDVYDYVY